jgi:hypothetical protein
MQCAILIPGTSSELLVVASSVALFGSSAELDLTESEMAVYNAKHSFIAPPEDRSRSRRLLAPETDMIHETHP